MEGCRVLTTVIMSLKRQNIMAEYLLNNATMNVTVSKFTWAIFKAQNLGLDIQCQ